MKLYLPDNIFSRLIFENLPGEIKQKTSFLPSALIAKKLSEENESVGFIPCLDIINHRELVVSKKYGIAFESEFANSFIYYNKLNNPITEFSLMGDVSSQEVILTKVFLKELYDIEASLNIITSENIDDEKNIVAVGSINYKNDNFTSGLSFALEMEDIVGSTYVNYILACKSETVLNDLHLLLQGIESKIYDFVVEENDFMKQNEIAEIIRQNISGVIYEFNEGDINSFEQLLQLPFMHSFIEEIPEVKYLG